MLYKIIIKISNKKCSDFFSSLPQIVSEDVNAKKLAEKYQANIVVSYSALETLLNSHPQPFEQQWEIPITVCKPGESYNWLNLS